VNIIAINVAGVVFVNVSPGLILYNDQHRGGGDFLSLGLVNGRIEFRFNVGSGPVSITSEEIGLYTWHTLRFRKHRNTGQFFDFYHTRL